MFIDTRVITVFDAKGIAGFRVEWVFDEMFTAMIIEDFDLDYDLFFSSSEIKDIEENAFSNLRNFHYFSYVAWDGGEYDGKRVSDFSASIVNDGLLMYRFFIPCRIKVGKEDTTVKIRIYDDSYYCDVGFAMERPVAFENDEGFRASYEIGQDSEITYYFGQISPQVLKLTVGMENG